MLIEINYDKPEFVAELYSTLADYYEKTADHENHIANLQKVKNIY